MREFDLLRHVYASNPSLPGAVTIPPGDDMGAVRIAPSEQVLVTVDQVADGVHVDLRTTPLEKVGQKAITRNLSDVAAMGARPVGAVAAVSLPRDFPESRARELFDAMRRVASDYHCPLFGGDVSMWPHPLIITVTVLAAMEPGVQPILRQGARVGDMICVTGRLGGSIETVDGYTHHLDFEPRLAIAQRLARDPALRPHCMIDLSDGLARDLAHLCEAADLGAELWSDRFPLSPGAHVASHRTGRPAWQHALSDGEDYELCFTLAPAQAESSLPHQIDGVPVTPIGVITPKPDVKTGSRILVKLPDGSLAPAGDWGWEHRGKSEVRS